MVVPRDVVEAAMPTPERASGRGRDAGSGRPKRPMERMPSRPGACRSPTGRRRRSATADPSSGRDGGGM